jgi:hypothetical protein
MTPFHDYASYLTGKDDANETYFVHFTVELVLMSFWIESFGLSGPFVCLVRSLVVINQLSRQFHQQLKTGNLEIDTKRPSVVHPHMKPILRNRRKAVLRQ